ncbi:50S ribosomal protein L23 [Rubrivirga marina]|uniref:Large ribosomal subunit protein uL23 n=1 Tax=Rubrivirga marina TaxID=1196024 RepID=A0A271J2B3_9BACT|nr:50S ribosomal protein L23 [Rubrivirga marina]PAP76849.1 50S ribosomal protein L23 [Rubrivirga marina]
MSQIIITPVLTEKSTRLADEGRHYSFRVAKDANKLEIRKAIEDRYPDVTVKEVRTMVVRGKRRRQFTKRGLVQGRQAAWKKAVVTLATGEIDFYESV